MPRLEDYPYPEHARLKAVRGETQTVGEFLEWLEGQACAIVWRTTGRDTPCSLSCEGSSDEKSAPQSRFGQW
jgi:hypothetical protein